MVIEFLIKNFENLMNYNFTSKIESYLDKIANGTSCWYNVIDSVYKTFHPKVMLLKKEKSSKKDNSHKIGFINDKPVIAFVGQYGPVIQVGGNEDKKLNNYYRVPKQLKIEDVTIDDVQKLMKFPLNMGKHKGIPILIKKGPYGFYINYDKQNISLPKKMVNLIYKKMMF